MGWGSYLLLGDLGQQLDIMQQREEMQRLRAAVAEAKSAPAASSVHDERIAQLEAEIDEMRLYVVAMMRLLLSKELVSREDLERMLKMVDGLDGKEDGRHSGDEAQPGQPRR